MEVLENFGMVSDLPEEEKTPLLSSAKKPGLFMENDLRRPGCRGDQEEIALRLGWSDASECQEVSGGNAAGIQQRQFRSSNRGGASEDQDRELN